MERRTRRLLVVVAVLLVVPGGPAVAQVYRWVDEEGNVHFGDRPQEPAAAARAEPVEIVPGYRPPERSDEQQAAYEASLREARELGARRREREARLETERAEEEREKRAALCAAYREEIKKFTGYHLDDSGRLTRFYLEEDGKSVSAARQRQYLEELRAAMAAAGC